MDHRGRREGLALTTEASGDRRTITQGHTMVEGLLEACGEDSLEGEVRETIHLRTHRRIPQSA